MYGFGQLEASYDIEPHLLYDFQRLEAMTYILTNLLLKYSFQQL